MATAESNTLLARELFMAPARQYEEQSGNRLAMMLKIAAAAREERLRRDLATQQAQREDARWTAQGAMEDARIAASDARTKSNQEAREAADIQNEIDRVYELYVAFAQRSKIPVKERSEFPSTRAGLGMLQKEAKLAEMGYQEANLERSAKTIVAGVEQRYNALEEQKKTIEALSEPTKEEIGVARNSAATALAKLLEPGADLNPDKKINAEQAKRGLAALRRADETEAKRILGADVVERFAAGVQGALFQMPNFKAKMAAKEQEEKRLTQLQSDFSRAISSSEVAAAQNPFLADGLEAFRTRTSFGAPRGKDSPSAKRGLADIFGAAPAESAATETEAPARTGLDGLVRGLHPRIDSEIARREELQQRAAVVPYQKAATEQNRLMDLIKLVSSGAAAAPADPYSGVLDLPSSGESARVERLNALMLQAEKQRQLVEEGQQKYPQYFNREAPVIAIPDGLEQLFRASGR